MCAGFHRNNFAAQAGSLIALLFWGFASADSLPDFCARRSILLAIIILALAIVAFLYRQKQNRSERHDNGVRTEAWPEHFWQSRDARRIKKRNPASQDFRRGCASLSLTLRILAVWREQTSHASKPRRRIVFQFHPLIEHCIADAQP
jgi:hypothetical protein